MFLCAQYPQRVQLLMGKILSIPLPVPKPLLGINILHSDMLLWQLLVTSQQFCYY